MKLYQRKSSSRIRSFLLRGDGNIEVFIKERSLLQEYYISISDLEPDPIRESSHDTQMKIWAIVFGIVLVLLLLMGIFINDSETQAVSIAFSILAVFPALWCWRKFRVSKYDVLSFIGKQGKPNLVLYYGLPTPAEFGSFVSSLQDGIRSKIISNNEILFEKIKELCYMREKGLLSEEEFKLAKTKVLGNADVLAPSDGSGTINKN